MNFGPGILHGCIGGEPDFSSPDTVWFPPFLRDIEDFAGLSFHPEGRSWELIASCTKLLLEQLGDEKVKVRVIHSGSGSITESDVLLALASKGIMIGFNSRPEPGAQRLAEMEGISIRHYNVIYELVKDVDKALKGLLEPTYTEVIEGQAEVLAVFEAGKKGKVAGISVKEGKVRRDSLARVLRQGELIHESRVGSLRRFKEDVKEVATGFECGVKIESFSDFQVGDIIQFYRQETVK